MTWRERAEDLLARSYQACRSLFSRPEATLVLGLVSGGVLVAIGFAIGAAAAHTPTPNTPNQLPMHHREAVNVNLGGWFCLEDWFYSGTFGRYVSTPDTVGQGACLPPVLTGPLDEPWPSEGVLTQRLVASRGIASTLDIFNQHRTTYITTSDLDDIASLGVQVIRLPLTWAAFADALAPIDPATYGKHNPDTDTVIVPDPFYHLECKLVTIPRNTLATLLRDIATRGMQVLLDMHAHPGGSSDGTYNGIYPNAPMFWTETSKLGNTTYKLYDAGHLISTAMIKWVEGLDAKTRVAVAGITVMNEPAHLLKGKVDEDKVLLWLTEAADVFRNSMLPARGVKLYMNVIETAFADFDGKVAPWWIGIFSEDERALWAVMDLHHYLAWTGSCKGESDPGTPRDGYRCEDALVDIRNILSGCIAPWAKHFADTYPGLRATTEFSLGTNQDALHACNDLTVLSAFFTLQLGSFASNTIEPFYWTWRMPYGPKFEAGWSFKQFSGLEGEVFSEKMCQAPKTPQVDDEVAEFIA